MRIFVTGGAGFIGPNFLRCVPTTQPDVRVTNDDRLDRFGLGEEMIQLVGDRPGHDLRDAVDAAEACEFDWAPAHGFGKALDATVDWYRANEWWWRLLKERGACRRRGLVRRA